LAAQAANKEAEVRTLQCQAATLADDSETAQIRAAKAEGRMHESHEEMQNLRQSAAQALAKEQVIVELIEFHPDSSCNSLCL